MVCPFALLPGVSGVFLVSGWWLAGLIGGFFTVPFAGLTTGAGGGDPAGRLLRVAGWAAFGHLAAPDGRTRLRIPPTLVWAP